MNQYFIFSTAETVEAVKIEDNNFQQEIKNELHSLPQRYSSFKVLYRG